MLIRLIFTAVTHQLRAAHRAKPGSGALAAAGRRAGRGPARVGRRVHGRGHLFSRLSFRRVVRSSATGQLLVLAARRHRARLGRALGELGLSAGQEALLREVATRDGIALTELAARLGVEPPTVTNMATRMERGGFVERQPDPNDARVKRLHLTPKGRHLLREVQRRCRAVEREALAALSADERAELARLLRKLVRAAGSA
jgi:MarR family transcriptional regulator, organic hydroperoxide resistance regulator